MNCNFPVKYALMPMYLDEEINGYIVSKCYVISEKKQYFYDGNFEFVYEVVFPFRKNIINKYERISFFSNSYKVVIDQIFDCFEHASALAEYKNKELLDKKIEKIKLGYTCNSSGELQKMIEQIKEFTLADYREYKEFETRIENDTADMVVTSQSEIDEIVDKIALNLRRFYINIASELSLEELNYLKTLIINKSCLNCSNPICKDKNNEVCEKWNNLELIGRQKLLNKNSK